jgi:Ca2+-binding EF-hand superfamily protein
MEISPKVRELFSILDVNRRGFIGEGSRLPLLLLPLPTEHIDELDNMLQSLGMDDPDVRSAQVPALMAQMDPEGTGKVTLESFNGVAVGA